ncbi:hypothetical protein D3C72_2162280 [compost metagenome]
MSSGMSTLFSEVRVLMAAGSSGSSFNCAWASASRSGVAGTPITWAAASTVPARNAGSAATNGVSATM